MHLHDRFWVGWRRVIPDHGEKTDVQSAVPAPVKPNIVHLCNAVKSKVNTRLMREYNDKLIYSYSHAGKLWIKANTVVKKCLTL
jgi:hypothetical protein